MAFVLRVDGYWLFLFRGFLFAFGFRVVGMTTVG